MDTIEQVINDNVTYLTEPVSFTLGDNGYFNEKADEEAFSFTNEFSDNALFLVEHFLPSEEIYLQGGTFVPEYSVTCLILKAYEEDSDVVNNLFNAPEFNLERNQLIQSCRTLGRQFVAALMSDSRVQKGSPSKVKMSNVYNLFDANLDGVMLELRIKILGDTICIPKHSAANGS